MKPTLYRVRGGKWLTPMGKRQKRLLIKQERRAREREASDAVNDSQGEP